MQSLLITGATGFIGSRFVLLNKERFNIIKASVRNDTVDDLDFTGVDIVLHLAALNHRFDKIADSEYLKYNCELTLKMANRAKTAGIQHFIFLSTVKVYGEENIGGMPFTELDECKPLDAYGRSKLLAELDIQKLGGENFVVSIIRSPMVYGPGVKGNMLRLIKLSDGYFSYILNGIQNSRSIVYLDNLIALINRIIELKEKGVFLACDGNPLSTSNMVELIRQGLGKKSGGMRIPGFITGLAAGLFPSLKRRLFGSYLFDNSSTNTKLNFTPPHSSKEGFAEMMNWYKDKYNDN